MKKTAHFLSFAFHPLLLPTFVFVLLGYVYPYFNTPYTAQFFFEIVIFIFVCTFLFPAVAIYVMYRWHVITDLVLSNKHERPYPMALTSLMYLVFTKILFEKIGIDAAFIHLMYFIGFLILFAGALTYFWKISAHALGVGGVCGFLIQLNIQSLDQAMLTSLICAFLISGLVMTARLLLQAHTQAQVYIGFIVGIIFGFLMSVLYV
tara:strand:+ start:1007 stop:1624 length:618 start_codon:yes stop_codon:yes gene_type:complete